MKSIKTKIYALATIIVVTTFFCVGLYWTKTILRAVQGEMACENSYDWASVKPSRLLSKAIETAPGVVSKSDISVSNRNYNSGLAIDKYLNNDFGLTYPWLIHSTNKRKGKIEYLSFNKKTGLIEYRTVLRKSAKDKWTEKRVYCVGPDGIAAEPDKKLGRFINLITTSEMWINGDVFYNKALRQFFRIETKVIETENGWQFDLANSKVIKGPQLDIEKYDIVQIGRIKKGRLDLRFTPPMKEFKKDAPSNAQKRKNSSYNTNKHYSALDSYRTHLTDKILALSSDGTIYMVDDSTLEIVSIAGNLPMASTMLGGAEKPAPKNLFAYDVKPLVVDGEYKGLMVASVSRDNTGVAVSVYDHNGKRLTTNYSRPKYTSRSRRGNYRNEGIENFCEMPGGLLVITLKYIVENLYPAGANVLSYFFSDSFEATKGYSNIFIIPDSFPAMFGRESTGNKYGQFLGVLGIISPSILIGLFLSWRVVKDARAIGIDKSDRRFWLIATIILGLPGYISYRIARPKQTLVTCENCGQLRRPDEEICHHCKLVWSIPAMEKPVWRVN
ncbi:MAG: hypothetical protein K8R02_04095 [Anaerohalosphaeraceae bacterium]|nr:hypothetical protein [Anaerohalosphaeraceae bacterium]